MQEASPFRVTPLSTLKGKEKLNKIQALTKWVPQPRTITRSIVNENIEKSLHRMSVNSIDLLPAS
jgi:hypothetical protein